MNVKLISISKKVLRKGRKLFKKRLFLPFIIISILVLAFLSFLTFYNLFFVERIYPNIYLANQKVGGLKEDTALKILAETSLPEKIVLASSEQTFNLDSKDFVEIDYTKSILKSYELVRTGNFFYDQGLRLKLLFQKKVLGLELLINEGVLNQFLLGVEKSASKDPIYPSLSLANGKVVVEKGQSGLVLEKNKLRALIGKNLTLKEDRVIEVPLKEINPSLNEEEATFFTSRGEKYLGKSLNLTFEDRSLSLGENNLLKILSFSSEFKEDEIANEIGKITTSIERPPQDAVFIFEDGRVKEFTASEDGIKVITDSLKDKIIGNLRTLESGSEKTLTFEIPVERIPPQIQNEEVNNLGIKELLGRGSSRFVGSIANRVFNVKLAASHFIGVLVKPGETFSFNNTLGDVSEETGYKQAYVIKEGKTILGDGGGVCQVSTTLFRAALNAGLPILERQAHAYRVGYYEQGSPPGLDATVYAPSPDLKIKNDTPNYILIQSTFDAKNYSLVFEIYGTNDGRKSTVSQPKISDQTPPPEDLYQDDPTLPLGTIKQVEHKAWGAKVTFNYSVERGGEIIYKKTFISNYKPWQAVYLRGTGAVQ